MSRLGPLFRQPGTALVPFITAGFPTMDHTVDLVLAAAESGAAMVELGMPFSDPLADGLVIQQASQTALDNGVTLEWIFKAIEEIRHLSDIPLALMGYINPILKIGTETFIETASQSGVDGLIIPDLPPDEGKTFYTQARDAGIGTVFLVAPNTPRDRIAKLGKESGELLYAVSMLGVTGTALSAREQLTAYLDTVRQVSPVPFVVGFGIRSPEDAAFLNGKANGVVVGSALLKKVGQSGNPIHAAKTFLTGLQHALANLGKQTI